MTVMTRSFKEGISSWFTPEARQRAYDYLISVGHSPESLKPIEWPDDALSASRNDRTQEWEFFTIGDRRRRRQEHAKEVLYMKREFGVVRIQLLYVWVFYNPNWIYTGWYTYLIGTGVSQSLNFRGFDENLVARLMELFPLIDPTLFGPGDFKIWMEKFAKRYKKGKPRNRRQGKAVIRCEVKGDQVVKILEVGQWLARKAV